MSEPSLFTISRSKSIEGSHKIKGDILLVKPPYFTPWTPPLGIAILKSYLTGHGYGVRCFDFNTDPELWGMHHKYFAALQSLESVSTNDGYSKLWWILNAHMLSCANGATLADCEEVLKIIIPLYGIRPDEGIIEVLTGLVDRFYRRLGSLIADIDLSAYSVVGTSTYTTSLGPSLFFLRSIKERHPQIKTIMGGGIFADDLALGSDNLDTLIKEYDFVDHIILGEGELLLLKLLQGELSDRRVISIADLKAETLNMRDVPSPDFSDFGMDNYYHLTIEGARSCPFQCSFCSETIQWGEYRKKPAPLFADQVIELASRFNNNTFFLGDSLMNPYIFQFSSALLEKEASILYDGYLRADKPVTQRDKVKVWARSGLYRARLGIESASAQVLESMDKMTTPKTISEALKSLASAGIRTTTYWITGFPGESEENFQETLEFIKEHHRYIYELEAHPYYYYPYGQIGSRLYQCFCLYPEEVTRHTRFKVWEIIDSNPPREERYERLRRISDLAAELGLPNIYTMAQRYQAEDRWHRLYPMAAEVYEGTRVSRNKARLPAQPLPALCDNWKHSGESVAGPNLVWAYHVNVSKRLDPATLIASMNHLAEYNEVLRFGLKDGQYHPVPGNAFDEETVTVYDLSSEEEGNLDSITAKMVKELSYTLRPEGGQCVRLGVINNHDGCNLLFLVHRAISDSKGVTLLLEDLFRAYEQVSNGREISLLPAERTYQEFAAEYLAESPNPAGHRVYPSDCEPRRQAAAAPVRSIAAPVGKSLSKRILSESLKTYGLRATDLFIYALLDSLSAVKEKQNVELDVTRDYRLLDKKLERTVGALTGITRIENWPIDDCSLLFSLRKPPADLISQRSGRGEIRGILNLDCCVAPPWLGGDEWIGQGFFAEEAALRPEYMFEITPMFYGGEIEIRLGYEDHPIVSDVIEEVARRFVPQLEVILDKCDSFVAAREFCVRTFEGHVPGKSIDIENDGLQSIGDSTGSIAIEIDSSTLEKLRGGCDADLPSLILTAFAVCLSRLNSRGDLAIAAFIATGQELDAVPLRVSDFRDIAFADLACMIGQRLALARKHSPYIFDSLFHRLPGERPRPIPVFDVAYLFSETMAGENFTLEGAIQHCPQISREPGTGSDRG